MRTVNAVAACMMITLLVGCSSGKSFTRADYDFTSLSRVAVVAVEGELESEAARNQIADFFGMELLKKGYTPIERQQIRSVMAEHEMQASGLTSTSGAAKAGRFLNADAAVIINIPKFGDEISLTSKMVDVEDGSVLWMGSGSAGTGGMLPTVAGAALGAGAGALAGGDRAGKTAAAVGGGVLGGVAGRALTPQQEKQAQKAIEKMCESLPGRAGRE